MEKNQHIKRILEKSLGLDLEINKLETFSDLFSALAILDDKVGLKGTQEKINIVMDQTEQKVAKIDGRELIEVYLKRLPLYKGGNLLLNNILEIRLEEVLKNVTVDNVPEWYLEAINNKKIIGDMKTILLIKAKDLLDKIE